MDYGNLFPELEFGLQAEEYLRCKAPSDIYIYIYIYIPSFLALLISFPFGHFFLIYTTFMLIVFVYVYSLEYIF